MYNSARIPYEAAKDSVMAVVTIMHHPELTPEAAMKIFQQGFAGKYEVYKWNVIGGAGHFAVKKSSVVGVAVKLKQDNNKTSFVFMEFIPSTIIRLIMPLLILAFLSDSIYRSIMDDVELFIWNTPEFK